MGENMNDISITIKTPFITAIDTKESEILINRSGVDSVVEYGPDKHQDIQYSDIKSIDFKPVDETDGYIKIMGLENATVPFDNAELNSKMQSLSDFLKGKITNYMGSGQAQGNSEFEYCYNCGSKIPKGIKFCPNCGADQYNKNAVSNQSNTTSNAWGIWLTIGWICFAIALIPKLSIFQLSAFVIGLTVQFKYGHKVAGMALWITSLVIFILSFMFGFMLGYYYGI